MTTAWNLDELRGYGGTQAIPAKSIHIIESLGRVHDIFEYHVYMARDAMKDIVDLHEPTGLRKVSPVLGDSHREGLASILTTAHVGLRSAMATVITEHPEFGEVESAT